MSNVLITLDIMWKGMLGIFTVMFLLMIVVFILGKIGKKKNKDKAE